MNPAHLRRCACCAFCGDSAGVTMRADRARSSAWVAALASAALAACATGGPAFPWRAKGPPQAAGRADVETVNPHYDRASFADPGPAGHAPDAGQPGLRRLPRQLHERRSAARARRRRGQAPGRQPPVRRCRRARVAHRLRSRRRRSPPKSGRTRWRWRRWSSCCRPSTWPAPIASRTWWGGCAPRAGGWPAVRRSCARPRAEGYLHDPGAGKPVELWIKIELAPWFRAFSDLPDEDGDGFPEVYGQVAPGRAR